MRWLSFIIILLVMPVSCQKKETIEPSYMPDLMEIPNGFPDIGFPEDNLFSEARWALGKKLFYDPVMSLDSSVSCASCHRAEIAFSDDLAYSLGVEQRPGTRNAPTLANVAYHPYLTRDGGVPTLEMQILVPIQEHLEFDFNIVLLAERLKLDSSYVKLAKEAYGIHPNAFVITRALACFERSLLSGYSRYDQLVHHDKTDALTVAEIQGMDLFFSERTQCSACHNGFNFTNYSFTNNGLYEKYSDPGRFRVTGNYSDKSVFKVPTLRNIELTAPYMHDGSINTLEEVIDHYVSGGKNHPNKSQIIQPLELSEAEKTALVLFLKSLTDASFCANPLFKK